MYKLEEYMSYMNDADIIKQNLKELLLSVFVDATEEEIDKVIISNYEVLSNWKLDDFQKLLNYLKENK